MYEPKSIAQTLLKLKAVSISTQNPFTWASGLKSPIYCDNRLIISTVEERRQVVAAFVRLLADQAWQPNLIAGTATAGIPHAAWLAECLSLPMVYVRASPKQHGKQNRIEGRLPGKAKVVVIEDLISTGGSSVGTAEVLQEAGATVLGVAAIFQYGLDRARQNFESSGIRFATLTDLGTLLEVAGDMGYLDGGEQKQVNQWREDPKAWS